jgi:PAS domain S-box-containing protein
MAVKDRANNKIPWGLISTYVFFLIGIFLFTFYFYNYQKDLVQKNEEKLFTFISNLKQRQIVDWRSERIIDAQAIFSNTYVKNGIKNYLGNQGDLTLKNGLQDWLETNISGNNNYKSVFLLDTDYKMVLHLKNLTPIVSHLDLDLAAKALTSGEIILSDFQRDDISNEIHLDLVIPIILNNKKLGVLIIFIDPYRNLYPLIQSLPVPSRTLESLLIERENDSVVYLNELSKLKNAALNLKFPVNSPELPSAKVIRGERGIMFGKDYYGENVVAFGQRIPSTPWFIVTKIETSELFEDVNERLLYIVVVAILFTIITTGAFGYYFNKQRKAYSQFVHRTENDKKALEKHYAFLIKNANDIILLLDQSGDIIFSNDVAQKIYGYTEDEFLKLNVKDIRSESTRHLIDKQMKKAYNEYSIFFETDHISKNGMVFPVEVSSRVIPIGEKKYLQSIIRDISERKESEKKIFFLNRIYSLLSDVNQMIVRIKNEDKLFEETCNIAVQTGGFRLAWVGLLNKLDGNIEIAAKAGFFNDYLNGFSFNINDSAKNRGPLGACYRSGLYNVCNDLESDQNMAFWRNATLKNKFRSAAAFPIKMNNRIIGTINLYSDQKNFFNDEEIKLLEEMSNDISYAVEFLQNEKERKKTEDALRKSWVRYKDLFESNPNPMWIYETDSLKFIDVNKMAIEHYGYTKSEFLSMDITKIRPAEDIPVLMDAITDVNEDILIAGLMRHQKKDGTIIYVEAKSNLLPFDSNKKVRIVLINDITEQRKMFEELIAAKETAEEANKVRNVFLGTMSHELRTPLIGILGYSEMLVEEVKKQEFVDMAKGIKRAGIRLLNTLNLILDYTRIEADKLEMVIKQFNLVDLLENVFEEFKGAALEKNLQYSLKINNKKLIAAVDENLFMVVMENLINNAIKFTSAGRITVSAHPDDAKKIVIKVSDTGIGIDYKNLEMIFHEFRQISEGVNREYQGTGLGLTITRKYVEMLGGSIAVESELSKGSTFTVTFPAV